MMDRHDQPEADHRSDLRYRDGQTRKLKPQSKKLFAAASSNDNMVKRIRNFIHRKCEWRCDSSRPSTVVPCRYMYSHRPDKYDNNTVYFRSLCSLQNFRFQFLFLVPHVRPMVIHRGRLTLAMGIVFLATAERRKAR